MCSAPEGVMNVESFMIDLVVKGLVKDSEKLDSPAERLHSYGSIPTALAMARQLTHSELSSS
jgi:hypothetical protein